jgi:hypothetical protein
MRCHKFYQSIKGNSQEIAVVIFTSYAFPKRIQLETLQLYKKWKGIRAKLRKSLWKPINLRIVSFVKKDE